jgi:hypothetical protein
MIIMLIVYWCYLYWLLKQKLMILLHVMIWVFVIIPDLIILINDYFGT